MKQLKNKNLAYGAAALLAGTMAFSACSSDEEMANVNPSFDGESVKTQFAINIPRAAQIKTRMTENNTQANKTFLGMQDIRLIPLTAAADANSTFEQMITLSDITGITTEKSNKIYKDVAIPTGTSHFLFYGQAKRATNATDAKNGILTATIEGQRSTADITFALNNVNTSGSVTNANSTALLAVLDAVANAQDNNNNKWSDTTDESLAKLYKDFTYSQAGSANSILCTMQSLYDALADNTSDLATAIKSAITQSGTFTLNGSTLSTTNTYPQDLNLPDGAVGVIFDSENKKFSYVVAGSTEATSDPIVNVEKITYPSSLYYWTSTPLRATDTAVDESSWPTKPADWEAENVLFNGDTWYDMVKASTQTVALKNNIDYGVANLALTVKCSKTVLQDNKKEVDGSSTARNVNVPDAGFPVSAVLVGNQPSKVGYDFAAVNGATFDKVIYDSECNLAAKYATSTPTETNYTLVLPTKGMDTMVENSKQIVRFVLELTNNSGTEFIGHNYQVIPKGGKFYLAGELNIKAENGVKNDKNLTEVFISDYLTKANVTISSLKDAYNVIPDLRATNLQLGLSVDLQWEAGIVFDVEIK